MTILLFLGYFIYHHPEPIFKADPPAFRFKIMLRMEYKDNSRPDDCGYEV